MQGGQTGDASILGAAQRGAEALGQLAEGENQSCHD
jgi:hypothetical protein